METDDLWFKLGSVSGDQYTALTNLRDETKDDMRKEYLRQAIVKHIELVELCRLASLVQTEFLVKE